MSRDLVARERIRGIRAVMAEREVRYSERFSAQLREAALLVDGVKLALAAVKEAGAKAEIVNEHYRASQNEWREAMKDRERDMMPRRETEALLATMNAQIGELKAIAERLAARGQGASSVWLAIFGAAGFISAGVAIVALLTK